MPGDGRGTVKWVGIKAPKALDLLLQEGAVEVEGEGLEYKSGAGKGNGKRAELAVAVFVVVEADDEIDEKRGHSHSLDPSENALVVLGTVHEIGDASGQCAVAQHDDVSQEYQVVDHYDNERDVEDALVFHGCECTVGGAF